MKAPDKIKQLMLTSCLSDYCQDDEFLIALSSDLESSREPSYIIRNFDELIDEEHIEE